MSPSSSRLAKPLPRAVVVIGSVLIGVHFLAIGAYVLAAPNGPWPTRFGDSTAEGPFFAVQLNDLFYPRYLQPLRLTHNYHFMGDHPLVSAVYFEAKVKDADGVVRKTVKFPQETSNLWLQHRYRLLALGLGNDQTVQPPRGEVIPAPGQHMQKIKIWDNTDPALWKLKDVPEHLIPKDHPVARPSEWSLVLAQSYRRFLLKKYNAAAVELVRHSKDQVMPGYMFMPEAPPGTFDELVCSFGEYRREN